MKDGFTVINMEFWKNDNCILVQNYSVVNRVFNVPIRIEKINKIKVKQSIGVWKIKSLKN